MKNIILSVYFEGTDGLLENNNSLASLFSEHTVTSDQSEQMAFDGCGHQSEYSSRLDLNGIFTFGLSKQVESVVKKVMLLLEDTSRSVTLNTFGFSRGGAATFLLAKKLNLLATEKLNRLKMNIAAIEPVPGNLITTTKIDVTGRTLANNISDLSNCSFVKKLLVIYTNELLPHNGSSMGKLVADAHAPILPCYPEMCEATIDVLYGCHKTAQIARYVETEQKSTYISDGKNETEENKIIFENKSAFLAFYQFKTFLENCGTEFKFDAKYFLRGDKQVFTIDSHIIKLYEELLKEIKTEKPDAIIRPMHNNNQITTSLSPYVKYLNRQHKLLYHSSLSSDELSIDDIAFNVEIIQPKKEASCCIL